MSSNQELRDGIEAEAKVKCVVVPDTTGKNNAQLVAVLKNLKETAPPTPDAKEAYEKAEAEKAEAEKAEAEKAEAEKSKPAAKAKAKKKPPYYMMHGKSLTTKAGIKSDGDEIKVEYLHDGEEGLKRHIENEFIGKS